MRGEVRTRDAIADHMKNENEGSRGTPLLRMVLTTVTDGQARRGSEAPRKFDRGNGGERAARCLEMAHTLCHCAGQRR